MDYLEWELDRQRGALRTLLGGGILDKEVPQEEGARREAAEPEAADGNAAGPTRRTPAASGSGRENPADRKRIRGTVADGPREEGGPALPVSAWERVQAGEKDAPAQRSRGGQKEGTPGAPGKPPREGTGPLAARSGIQGETPPAREGKTVDPFEHAGKKRAGDTGGERASEHHIAAMRLAGRRPVWFPELEEASGGTGFRGGGETAAGMEDGVRALSRAVQRDARRYDGGFTIY